MSDPIDLNTERKRRRGLSDDGRCRCGLYVRLLCRGLCLRDEGAELAKRTTKAQGIPTKVEDPVMLADLARMQRRE